MGMYNYVTTEEKLNCPLCGEEMPEQYYQSKDMVVAGIDRDLLMDSVKMEDIEDGEMHGGCEACHNGVQFNIRDGKVINGERR